MAKMNYPTAPDGCQPGERVVFNALKRYLPDDYFGWHEPTLFGDKRSARPDFLVLGRDIGLIIVEVKDWSIDKIRGANRDTFEIFTGSQLAKRTNPEKQVEGHFRVLKEEIERYRTTDQEKYSLLLRTSGKHEGKLAVSIAYLVAFPNISRHEWRTSELHLPNMINEKRVLLKEDLGEALLTRLRTAPTFSTTLSKKQIDTLKWMLYPETRVPGTQGQLFTLDPDQLGLAKLDTYLPEHAQLLYRKQQAKLIRGVVGSGKTLILLFRAKFLSEQNPNWRVLVLTYNKSLREYLRQVFSQIEGDSNRVEIVNFHKWCRELLLAQGLFKNPQNSSSQKGLIANLLQEAKVTEFDPEFLAEEFNWIKERVDYRSWQDYLDPQKVKRTNRERGLGRSEIPKRQLIYDLFCRYQARLAQNKSCDWADLPVMVLRAMDDGLIKLAQYHAILIDEAQDFAPAWFRVAFRMIKPETSMVFMAGDGAQKIYARDFTWKELGLGITSQNSYILRRSYRSTREIVEVALEAIRNSQTLIEELQSAGDTLVEPDGGYNEFRHGPLPVLLSFESPDKEYSGIAAQILSLLQQGYLPKDMVILQRHRSGNERMAQELRSRGVACTVVSGDLDFTAPAVKICTFHSAKGLEFEVVFICGLEEFKINEPIDIESQEFQQLLDQERKLLYVGMTRARRLLYITYSGVAPEWIIDRLQKKLEEMQPQ
ncbi:MAG: DNA helicase [Chloroflexota bacterium]|nr:MAG: DNA helicase [Chloroflexota bacterium]